MLKINSIKKIIVILIIFFLDRISKFYLLELETSGTEVDFYVFSFLNLYLVWNTGIAFGLVSLEANNYYHVLTGFILVINLKKKIHKNLLRFLTLPALVDKIC